MKRTVVILIAAVLLLSLCLTLPVSAQDRGGQMDEERINKIAEKLGITPEEVKQRMKERQGGQAGMGRGGMAGGGMAGGGMAARGGMPMNRQMPEAPAQMLATEKYLFILKGNTVYQLDIDSLKLLNQTQLGEGPNMNNTPEAMKEKIEKWVTQTKEKIEALRAEGKDEEADKLQEMLNRRLEMLKNGKNMMNRGNKEGWNKRKKDRPVENAPDEGDGLF